MLNAPASSQPRRRGPIAEAGWATATGSTNMRSAAVDAVAARGVTIPAYRTANPTTAMATTAANSSVEASRADDDETAAHGEEREVSGEPRPRPPGELHQEQEGERAERGEQVHLAVRERRRARERRLPA